MTILNIIDMENMQTVNAELICMEGDREDACKYKLVYEIDKQKRESTPIWLKHLDLSRLERQGRLKWIDVGEYGKHECQLDVVYNKQLNKAVYYIPHQIYKKKKFKIISFK